MLANGRTIARDAPAGTIGLTGGEPVKWVRTTTPAEVVEISADASLRKEIAEELRAEAHADLADIHGWENFHAWAIVDRFRSVARGRHHLNDVERDSWRFRGGKWTGSFYLRAIESCRWPVGNGLNILVASTEPFIIRVHRGTGLVRAALFGPFNCENRMGFREISGRWITMGLEQSSLCLQHAHIGVVGNLLRRFVVRRCIVRVFQSLQHQG